MTKDAKRYILEMATSGRKAFHVISSNTLLILERQGNPTPANFKKKNAL
jgi:hypothetical protein